MSGSRRGGRTAAPEPNGRVTLTLPPDAIKCLEILKEMGRYGSNVTAVANYLITREIDDLTRAGVLSPPAKER